MVTSLLREFEKCGQPTSQLVERGEPRGEEVVTVVGEGVRALRRSGELGTPLRGDEPVLLERAQSAIEVSDVDAIVA
jgi:hypothetical protein